MPNKPKRTCQAGSNFATALQAHGISNKEMAETMGCHNSTITGWRYKGVPEQHAQLASEFLHVKPTTITARNKKRGKKFLTAKPRHTVFAQMTPAPTAPTAPEAMIINGIEFVPKADMDGLHALVESVKDALWKLEN
jgi:hypothetical protein